MKMEPSSIDILPLVPQTTSETVPALNMIPGSDSSSEQEEYSDRDELRPTSHTLGITRNYVPTWSRRDAFRELYQNWKDAIITTFGLTQRSFKTEVQETEDVIQILVHHPVSASSTNPRRLLGYILFKKKQGSVELTNFRAQMTRHNLELGGSTKRGNNAVAGTHGEGLKVAALVLRRANHRVRLTSKSYNWTFGLRGLNDTLYCRLSPVSERQIRLTRKIAGNLKADPAEDVCILIDRGRKGGRVVSEVDFRKWIKVTLDITRPNDPNDIVETPYGDLILDKNFAGKMYLKGLLLPNGGSNIIRQKAGYNLFDGHTNRDRERLKNEDQEAEMLMHIWEHSIAIGGERIAQTYIGLLQDHYNCVDVSRADHLISQKTAVTIWDRLKTEGTAQFYYDKEESNSGVSIDIIKKHLKRQPAPLSAKLWKILRKYSLVHTPEEERIRVFKNSSASEEQETDFSKSIQHGLKASLALSQRTEKVQVEYVSGAETDIDMLFDKERQLLKVHEKWLNFVKTHETAPCRISMASNLRLSQYIFCCDHIIEELYELAVQEIIETSTSNHTEAMKFARSMRLKVREKLQQMPRMISMKKDGPRRLVVSWTNGENDLIRKALGNIGAYYVILHRDRTCSQKRSEYLFRPQRQDNYQPMTDRSKLLSNGLDKSHECRLVVVCHPSRQAVFSELDPRESYFPMIASEEELAFFGMPPSAIQPLDEPPAENLGLAQAARHTEDQEDIPLEEPSIDMVFSGDGSENLSADNNRDQQPNETRQGSQCARSSIVQSQPGSALGAQVANSTPIPRQQPNNTQLEQQSEQVLLNWEKEKLQSSFDSLFVSRNLEEVDFSTIMFLAPPQVGGYRFMMNEYAQIRLRPEIATTEAVECVVFVHRIYKKQNENEETQFFLLATRYSFLALTHPFSSVQKPVGSINRKELLLHFTDFDTMGERQDAEIIPINEIIEARNLEFEPAPNAEPVQLSADPPAELEACGFYCRLAIRSRVGNESACITPLGSNLLRHHERWKIPEYSSLKKPIVVDYTPPILGLAEGFSQEGYEVAAGVGFSTVHDMTWKARYASAEVYDGARNNVLQEIANGHLAQPSWLQSGTAKVAVIGTFHRLYVSEPNKKIQLKNPGLYQLALTVQQIMSSSIHGPNYFDFLVCVMPATALFPSFLPTFMQTIKSLLERRYSVHIHKVQLPSYGLLLDKSFILVLASPICAKPPWDWDHSDPFPKKIEEVIGDLSFQNPRQDPINGPYTLRCKKLSSNTEETVYNHNTGYHKTPGATKPSTWNELTTLRLPLFRVVLPKHPVRNDLLTVREMARIFGFPDDFVFYDRPLSSYRYFLDAVPPPIAAIVARGVRKIIDQFRGWDMGGPLPMEGILPTSGGNKRPRLD